MASLMEEMLQVLEGEQIEYEQLLQISKDKTSVIIANDIQKLQEITDREQLIVARIQKLDKKSTEILQDMKNVLSFEGDDLTIAKLVAMLKKQPAEENKLALAYDKLMTAAKNLKMVNEQNRMLVEQSLEMIEFDLNLYQSMNSAPKNANYDKNATNIDQAMISRGGFDAKQ